MKAVVLPGVGFHSKPEKYEGFVSEIKKHVNFDCEFEIHYWEHDWLLPEVELPWRSVRSWVYEVILDFQQVVKYAYNMEIPKADFYIGHSAGSILSLAQDNAKGYIIFGSPAVLVECIHKDDVEEREIVVGDIFRSMSQTTPVYNIINKYDQLAYYLQYPNVENYVYSGSWFNFSTYNPYSAHEDYWENKKIIKKMAKKLNQWNEQGE